MESEAEAVPVATGAELPEELEIQIVDLSDDVPAGYGIGAVDAPPSFEIPKDKGSKQEKTRETPRDAKSGPPTAVEWQDFIGGTVLRILTEGYLHLVLFREIDESELTERERDLIRLDRDDLKDIAAPMASFANKSKLARKHGRAVIALGDSYESLIDLFIWMRRVNKIAKKYRKPKPVKGEVIQDGQVPTADFPNGNPGTIYPGQIFNPGTG